MQTLRTLLAAAILALAPAYSQAQAYYVAPAQGDGIEAGLLKTLERLIASSVNEAGQSAVEAEAAADWTLKPELLKLGSSLILTLARLKAGTREVAFAGKLKAGSADELDTVAARLTRSVLKGESADGSARLGEVTAAEQTKLAGRQVQSRNSEFFGLGPMRFNSLNTPDNDSLGYYLCAGMQFDVSAQASITLMGESSFKLRDGANGSIVGAAGLGGAWYFSDGDTAPFAALDLGYGGCASDGTKAVFGFSGGARLGVMFFRTASTQLSLAIRHLSIFENNGSGYPGHSGLVLAVSY